MLVNSILGAKPTIMSEHCGEEMVHLGADTFHMNWPSAFNAYTVDKSYIARPDLISKLLYGDERYGDLICKINGISNPFELNEGMKIVVPSVEDVTKFINEDKFDDNVENNVESGKPKPKAKNEKRKPNEAIIGDTRFKIDKTRRVIIY